MIRLPSASISFFSMPRARSGWVLPMELLQTNSASRSLTCAAVGRTGRISTRRTRPPRVAQLPGRFAAGQTTPNHGYHSFLHHTG